VTHGLCSGSDPRPWEGAGYGFEIWLILYVRCLCLAPWRTLTLMIDYEQHTVHARTWKTPPGPPHGNIHTYTHTWCLIRMTDAYMLHIIAGNPLPSVDGLTHLEIRKKIANTFTCPPAATYTHTHTLCLYIRIHICYSLQATPSLSLS